MVPLLVCWADTRDKVQRKMVLSNLQTVTGMPMILHDWSCCLNCSLLYFFCTFSEEKKWGKVLNMWCDKLVFATKRPVIHYIPSSNPSTFPSPHPKKKMRRFLFNFEFLWVLKCELPVGLCLFSLFLLFAA